MKCYYFLIIAALFFSCSPIKKNKSKEKDINRQSQVISHEFQSILDSAGVNGSLLVYDFQANTYYANDFTLAKKGQLPASTFKIPHSIIALESEVVKDDKTISKWDGKKRYLKTWEQDLSFKDAFHFSCVPCYQDIAKRIGVKRMNDYLNKFNYGNVKVDSSNLTNFWLAGDARISPFQQIDFLKKLYTSQLPISKRTNIIMKKMMIINKTDKYTLSGKTGWSVSNEQDNGWFVGYLESKQKTYFFATNISPNKGFDMRLFSKTRKELTFSALRYLGQSIHFE